MSTHALHGEAIHWLDKKKHCELQKKHIGFGFQSYHLLGDLTVYENLEIPLSYRDVPKKERESVVCDLPDRFGIVAKKDLYPNQPSGGQQQPVGGARALPSVPAGAKPRQTRRLSPRGQPYMLPA